jgi:hypothetical protein
MQVYNLKKYFGLNFAFFARWLENVRQVADTDDNPCEVTTNEENSEEDSIGEKKVSWSAFHSNLQQHKEISNASVTQTSLLPLFYDEAHSIAMIRHAHKEGD